MTRTRMLALLALACAGCPKRTTDVEVKRAVSPAVTPTVSQGSRPRMAWVSWDDVDTLVACNRHVDDSANTVGALGPCVRVRAGAPPEKVVAANNREQPDRTFSDRSPWSPTSCSLSIEDAVLVPATKPARLVMRTPGGPRELEQWAPGNTPGDAFSLEASFAPGGKWMAIVRVAVGLGEGERTVEVAGGRVVPVPDCH